MRLLDFSTEQATYGVAEAVVQRELLRPFMLSTLASVNFAAALLPLAALRGGHLTELDLSGSGWATHRCVCVCICVCVGVCQGRGG